MFSIFPECFPGVGIERGFRWKTVDIKPFLACSLDPGMHFSPLMLGWGICTWLCLPSECRGLLVGCTATDHKHHWFLSSELDRSLSKAGTLPPPWPAHLSSLAALCCPQRVLHCNHADLWLPSGEAAALVCSAGQPEVSRSPRPGHPARSSRCGASPASGTWRLAAPLCSPPLAAKLCWKKQTNKQKPQTQTQPGGWGFLEPGLALKWLQVWEHGVPAWCAGYWGMLPHLCVLSTALTARLGDEILARGRD